MGIQITDRLQFRFLHRGFELAPLLFRWVEVQSLRASAVSADSHPAPAPFSAAASLSIWTAEAGRYSSNNLCVEMEILKIAVSVGILVLYSHPNKPILDFFIYFFIYSLFTQQY